MQSVAVLGLFVVLGFANAQDQWSNQMGSSGQLSRLLSGSGSSGGQMSNMLGDRSMDQMSNMFTGTGSGRRMDGDMWQNMRRMMTGSGRRMDGDMWQNMRGMTGSSGQMRQLANMLSGSGRRMDGDMFQGMSGMRGSGSQGQMGDLWRMMSGNRGMGMGMSGFGGQGGQNDLGNMLYYSMMSRSK